MKTTVVDEYGLVVFRDASLQAPESAGLKDAFKKTPLQSMAKDGSIFFIDREDPTRLKVEVLVDTPPNEEYCNLYDPVGGRFLLRVPSGDLSISGYEAWASGDAVATESLTVPPGVYSLSVFTNDPMDIEKYEAELERLVGPADLRFSNRVNYVGAAGCLPIAIAALVAIFASWKVALYFVAAAGLFYWPYLVLLRSSRYRGVEKIRKAYEEALPVFILRLERVESTEGLAGGFVL